MPAPSCQTCYYSTACGPAESHPEFTNPLLCNKPVTLPYVVWPRLWPVVERSFWCLNYVPKPIYPGYEWILPTGTFEDEPAQWSNPELAIDGKFITQALYPSISAGNNSTFLELLILPPVICDKIRYSAFASNTAMNIDIDLYYNSAWNDLYEGEYGRDTLNEIDIEDGPWTIEKARFRFKLATGFPSPVNRLYEFHFDKVNVT